MCQRSLPPADQQRYSVHRRLFSGAYPARLSAGEDFSAAETLHHRFEFRVVKFSLLHASAGSHEPALLRQVTKFATLRIELPQYDLAPRKRLRARKAAEFTDSRPHFPSRRGQD